MLLRSIAALGLTVVCASAASAQTIYEPAGHTAGASTYYRSSDPVGDSVATDVEDSLFNGGHDSIDYRDKEYLSLPPAVRDGMIWSLVQNYLEEHLDYAFSFQYHYPGPRYHVGREITARDVYRADVERMPRFFRKRELMQAGQVRSDGSRTVPAGARVVAVKDAGAKAAAPAAPAKKEPQPILIIPKDKFPKEPPAKASDKQVASVK